MLISIETHRICDFPDRGSGSPTPPPPLDPHMGSLSWKSTALCELQFEIMKRPVSTSNTTCSLFYLFIYTIFQEGDIFSSTASLPYGPLNI